MSFQAYIDNIYAKTGVTPEQFEEKAKQNGLLEPGVRVGQIVEWLKQDYGLGHGHAMAIVQCFKNSGAYPPAKKH